MTTATLTLTEFLLARIAEDEKGEHGRWCRSRFLVEPGRWGVCGCKQRRILAECRAKRGAIDAAWDDHERIDGEWGMCQSREQMDAKDDVPAVVAHLATVYSEHPDYRDEWRP